MVEGASLFHPTGIWVTANETMIYFIYSRALLFRLYFTAAVTTISTNHSGLANLASTVARGGAWPGATHSFHTVFIE